VTINVRSRTSYLAMIRLQKLAKASAEMELSRLGAQAGAIEEENTALFRMHSDRFDGSAAIVPASIIMRRLETNKMRQAQLGERMIAQRQELVRVSRTLQILDRRLHALGQVMERCEAAAEMDEYIGHLLAKGSI
jgi:hypothetical protein